MMTNNFASQSTEARNSAVVNFSNNSYYSDKIQIPILGFSRDSIITWVGKAVEVERKDVRFCGWIEGGKSIEVHLTKDYFTKNYNVDYTIFDDGKVNMEKSGSIDLDFKVLKGTNINKAVWAITRALEELPYYFVTSIDSNEIEAIEDADISEAPSLEDDYTIEEVCDGFYEIKFLDEDGITEEGYSIMGLNYLRETMVDADMEDIVDEAYEEVSNDLYVWINELFRCGPCPKNEFMDIMWAYAWEIIMDRGLSDEALEAETRYYTEFDDIVERRLEEWGLYERYNKIYMERTYSNR